MNSGAIPLLVVLALVTAVPRHSPAQDMTSPPTAQGGDDFRPLDHELLNSSLPSELHVTLLERKAIAEQEALVFAASDRATRRSTLAGMIADLPAWKAGAEKGWPEAMVLLALCYTDGVAVPQDSAEAEKWFRKAADQGNALGQVGLGVCYRGGEGVARDPAEAVERFRQAAAQGHALGQYWLGKCYRDGEGVARDRAEAVKWFRKAADQGHKQAQELLK